MEALNEELEEEAGVLSRISDIIHSLFLIFNQNFVPYFEKIIQHFIPYLSTRRFYSERQWAICIFDDFIEFGGEASIRYQEAFYGPMVTALSDEYPEVRQAAAYGLGLMGQSGYAGYAQACAGLLCYRLVFKDTSVLLFPSFYFLFFSFFLLLMLYSFDRHLCVFPVVIE